MLFFSVFFILDANAEDSYRITSVEYDITGKTREFPLTKAVKIDYDRIFNSRSSLDYYIDDLLLQFSNQRVLESATIDTIIMTDRDENDVISVSLVVHTIDSINIIVLPKPGFDSNSGFELKIKLKDYNFFGSMQELNSDVAYSIDNNGKSSFSTNLDFSIPFTFSGYEMEWNNDLAMDFPLGEKPEFSFNSGMSIAFPLSFSKVILAFNQKVIVNDRDSEDVLYTEDSLYLNEKISISMPVEIIQIAQMGSLIWTPNASANSNIAPGGIDHEDLRGTGFSLGHALSLGRVDWIGNFREGFLTSLGNDYGYNTEKPTSITVSVSALATGFVSIGDRFGINSRMKAMHVLSGSKAIAIAEPVRGILNKRVDSDSAVSLNVDFPVTLMDINFVEITGVSWTKYIGFEMQASPFFDIMLTHDPETGKYYSLTDGWYSGGMEILVYLKKLRSITLRASAGYDLQDFVANGWSMRDRAARDDASTHEYVIGLGLHY